MLIKVQPNIMTYNRVTIKDTGAAKFKAWFAAVANAQANEIDTLNELTMELSDVEPGEGYKFELHGDQTLSGNIETLELDATDFDVKTMPSLFNFDGTFNGASNSGRQNEVESYFAEQARSLYEALKCVSPEALLSGKPIDPSALKFLNEFAVLPVAQIQSIAYTMVMRFERELDPIEDAANKVHEAITKLANGDEGLYNTILIALINDVPLGEIRKGPANVDALSYLFEFSDLPRATRNCIASFVVQKFPAHYKVPERIKEHLTGVSAVPGQDLWDATAKQWYEACRAMEMFISVPNATRQSVLFSMRRVVPCAPSVEPLRRIFADPQVAQSFLASMKASIEAVAEPSTN